MAKGGHKLTELAELAMETRVRVIVITETHFDQDAGFQRAQRGGIAAAVGVIMAAVIVMVAAVGISVTPLGGHYGRSGG